MSLTNAMIEQLGYLLTTPPAWRALVSWPKFSLTSFRMLSSLMRQGISPRTVIDVGANVGQFAVASAKIFPDVTVYSFEPMPDCAERLKQNVKKLSGIHIFPIALGAKSGEVLLHINSHTHSSSILTLGQRHREAFPGAKVVDSIRVPLSTLDQELDSVSLSGPVLLKLDVQGYEPQVLEGANLILNKVDYVILEASFRPMYEGEESFLDVIRGMQQRGFDFLRPVGWLNDPRNDEVLQADLLFERHGSCSQ